MEEVRNLITGGAGFIGSHLAEYLLARGESVIVWDDLSTGRMSNVKGCIGHTRFRYVISDFIHDAHFESVVREVDIVYHLAAAVGVELIFKDPIRSLETNILGTEVALGAAAKYGKRVFIASTSEVYGKGDCVPFREDGDLVYGATTTLRWNYAMSKAVDEFLMLAYARSHALNGVVGRLFNTVGPRQVPFYGMVLPRFVSQARRGDAITVYGDGSQIRCFGHVLDVVPAIHKLMHTSDAFGTIVNIGSDEETTILALAEKVKARLNSPSEIVFIPFERAFGDGFEDMRRRVPDLSRAQRLIGYRVTRKLDDIIEDVLACTQ